MGVLKAGFNSEILDLLLQVIYITSWKNTL
jgi:hypothetical protein